MSRTRALFANTTRAANPPAGFSGICPGNRLRLLVITADIDLDSVVRKPAMSHFPLGITIENAHFLSS